MDFLSVALMDHQYNYTECCNLAVIPVKHHRGNCQGLHFVVSPGPQETRGEENQYNRTQAHPAEQQQWGQLKLLTSIYKIYIHSMLASIAYPGMLSIFSKPFAV